MTLCKWLRQGRAYNAASAETRAAAHAMLGTFAADLDRAGAQYSAVLHGRVAKGTESDPRLAFDVVRWNSELETRRLKRDLLRAQVEIERLRAKGELIARTDVTTGGKPLGKMTDAELAAERDALLAELRSSGG